MQELVSDIPIAGIIGWIAMASVITGYDVWAKLTGHPTMSAAYWHYRKRKTHPYIAPIIIGAWLFLTYHLLVEDILKELRNKNGLI